MPLSRGNAFGRYIVEEPLGEGGMGRVFRAQDTVLHRRVALKVLHEESAAAGGLGGDSANGSEGKARLMREARAAAAFDHPNAVSIFDVGEAEGLPYIAMELVEGRPLRSYVGDADVAIEERVRWLVDVARALSAAHKQGLVHRDMKPENVMVRDDGVVKVLDFGIAKRRAAAVDPTSDTEASALATITGKGVVVGTPTYMAPEQIRNEPLDGRADQFAWGVLAYELLSGKLPWRATDAMQLISQILTAEPAPLEAGAIPANVAAVITRALSKRAAERFSSMDDIVKTLAPSAISSKRDAALAATERFEPTPPATTAPVRHRPTWAIGAVATLAFIGVGALVSAGTCERDKPAPLAASAAPSASASSTRMADLPIPKSSSPEAMLAYAAGMRAVRDSASGTMREAFEQAVKADPSYAAAHLRLAQAYFWFRSNEKGREELAEAARLRSSLSPSDLANLEIMQAFVQRSPPDFDKVLPLVRDLAARFPNDPEIALGEMLMFFHAGRMDDMEKAAERTLALDPTICEAWNLRGLWLERRGKLDEASKAFEECVRLSPLATTCGYNRLELLAKQGKCAELEDAARARIATAPKSSTGYSMLGEALAAQGKPIDAVLQAFEQHWERIPESQRAVDRAGEEARIAVFRGDFAGSIEAAKRLEKALGSGASSEEHGTVARLIVDALVEQGKVKDAVPIVDAFLARKEGYVPDVWHSAEPMESDATLALLIAKRKAGAISAAELRAARDAWIAKWKGRAPEFYAHDLWAFGYLATALDAAEAKEALDARAAFEPLTIGAVEPSAELGRVLLLAGRAAEAIAPLRDATRHCNPIGYSLAVTRAHAWLGEALEATGDDAGACAAYKVVVDRWGSSASSVTAARVKARTRALSCK